MKYIEKDEAYKIVLHYGSYAASAKIADLPSIDLVRCKECKYWCEVDTSDGLRYGQCDHPHSAIRGNCFIRESWFCADGERSET